MKKIFNVCQMLCLYSVLFTTQFLFSTYSLAKKSIQCEGVRKELKARRYALSTSAVIKNFDRINNLMGKKGKEKETLEKLEEQEDLVKNRPYDLAKVYHIKAQVYYSMDKLQEAFEYYNKAIALNKLPYSHHLSVLRDMTAMYMQQDNFKKAEEMVDRIFCLEGDKVARKSYMLKAVILHEKKQTKKALEMAMKAIEKLPRPPEGWLARVVNLHLEMEHYVSAVKLLTKLTARYPKKKKYWKSLSQAYSNIDKNSKATSTLDLVNKVAQGLEKESEILNLSGLLNEQGQPFKAAKLIGQSIEKKKVRSTKRNYEILGDFWRGASEITRALSAYEKAYKASKAKKKNWKLPTKIGDTYFNQQSWNKALEYFRVALAVTGVKRPENLYKKIGYALYYLKKCQEAKQSFEKVITIPEATSQSIKETRGVIDYISESCLDQRAETTE